MMRRKIGDVGIHQTDRSFCPLRHSGETIKERRLASAIGTDDTNDRILPYPEAHLFKRPYPAEMLRQISDLKKIQTTSSFANGPRAYLLVPANRPWGLK